MLPSIDISAKTMPEILQQYREIISGVTHRAAELEAPGLVVEFKTLPPMTQVPQWGIDITKVLVDGLEDAFAKTGLKSTVSVRGTTGQWIPSVRAATPISFSAVM